MPADHSPTPPPSLPEWVHQDRTERLRRTRALAAAEVASTPLEAEEAAWLAFAFRASDPLLYQASALALGRHRNRSPLLETTLAAYEEALGVEPGAPITLAGRRGLRRLILVRAGEGILPPGVLGPPSALDGGEVGRIGAPPAGGEAAPLHPRDLGAWLVAARHLLEVGGREGPLRDAERQALVAALLARLGARPSVGPPDRVLEAHAGRALVAALRSAPEELPRVRQVWPGVFPPPWTLSDVVPEPGPGGEPGPTGVAERVRLRLRLDEAARTAAHLRHAGGGGPWPPPRALGKGATRFFMDRQALWASLEVGESGGEASPEESAPRRSPRGLAQARAEARARTVRAGRALASPRNWFALSTAQRGQALFHLLDPSLPRLLPGEERARMGQAFPVEVGAALARFLAFEPQGVTLLDPALVHRLRPATLFTVLAASAPGATRPGATRPGATSPEDAGELDAALADALEHRFRVALATDPDFPAQALVDALQVARPRRRFLAELSALASTRSYTDPLGRPFPLGERLETVQGDLDVHQKSVHQEDLASALRRAGEVLLHRVPRHLRKMERARRLGGAPDPALRRALTRQLRTARQGGEALTGLAGRLAPTTREAGARVEGTLTRALGTVRRIQGELAGALPRETDGSLAHLAALEPRLAQAQRALVLLPQGSEGEVAALARVDDLPLRRALLALAFQASMKQGEGTVVGWARWQGSGRALGRCLAIPRAHFRDEADYALWLEWGAEQWATLAREAREAGFPRRVAALVRDPALTPGATHPLNRLLLMELRGWLLDVHRPSDAAAAGRRARDATRAARADSQGALLAVLSPVLQAAGQAAGQVAGQVGSPLAEGARILGALVVRHAALWLALLVGAILMLDFGDAWKAMAEVGDVRGIGITAALGLGGALAWLLVDQRRRVRLAPEDPPGTTLAADLARVLVFLGVMTGVAVAITAGLWFLLSGTDQVVHGPGAPLHVAAWAAFTLFAGVFLGLLAKEP